MGTAIVVISCVYAVALVAFALAALDSVEGAAATFMFLMLIAVLVLAFFGHEYMERKGKTMPDIELPENLTAWMQIVLTTTMFALASAMSATSIKHIYASFHPRSYARRAVLIGCAIGLLIPAFMFAGAPQVNEGLRALFDTPVPRIVTVIVCSLVCWLCWELAGRSARRHFFESLLLTLVPGLCWFSRIAGSEAALWLFGSLLLVSLAYFGFRYSGQEDSSSSLLPPDDSASDATSTMSEDDVKRRVSRLRFSRRFLQPRR